MIRILVVDDHAMVRSGLSTFLRVHDDLDVVGLAASGEAALEMCAENPPDIVLVDLIMPRMSGVEAISALRARYPQLRAVALTSFENKAYVAAAMKAGAAGCLFKDISGDELADSIRRVYAGQTVLSDLATRALVEALAFGHTEQSTPADLSDRERQVLGFITQGMSNREIAYHLRVKHSTVKTYVSRVLSKLNAASRVEAATIALRNNLIAH